MAARLNPRHTEMVREKIRVSQLITRLQNHALGRKGVKMNDSQIKAAGIVLNKAMADPPRPIVVEGNEDNPIRHNHKVEFVGDRPAAEEA
jgi:hypothetical protein